MRIVYRDSGGASEAGRGEYEVSGESDGYVATDTLEKHVSIVLASGWKFKTQILIKDDGGKVRFRMEIKREGIQIHRQVCAALLFNSPTRSRKEVREKGGQLVEYMEASKVEIIGNEVIFYLKSMEITDKNATALISIEERVKNIHEIWKNIEDLPNDIKEKIEKHKEEVTSGNFISSDVEKTRNNIEKLLLNIDAETKNLIRSAKDILPALQSLTNAPVTKPIFTVDYLPIQEDKLKERDIILYRRWKFTNVRGAAGRRFRESVRNAYKSTCFICGFKLPPTDISASGVDAAHILPWREYEADEIYNGICLCKSHHWAFDENLLAIVFDELLNFYRVFIPEKAKKIILAEGDKFTLSWLESAEGLIPNDRLPKDILHWPRPDFLTTLTEIQKRG